MSAQLFNSLLELGSEGLGRLSDGELFTLNQLLKEEQYDKLDARCSRAIVDEREFASTDCGPLYWLQNLTKTVDDHALAKRTPAKAPFPRKTYFQPLMGELLRPVLHPSPECYVNSFRRAGR